jgi:uroporphyrinogen-III decarboxylase
MTGRVFRTSERNRGFNLSKELLVRALRGKSVEQTPWLPHIGTHAAQLLGVSAERYLQDAELLARGAILCADRYSCDGIPLLDDPQMEAVSLGCTLHWSEQSPPSVISSPLYGIPSEHLVSHLPPLPDEGSGHWPVVIAAGKMARAELEQRDVALVGIVAGPCTIAYNLRGLALFTDLFRHPGSAEALFAFAGQVSAISARSYAEVIGCDVVAINDTPATMLKPDYFQQYVIPNLQPALQSIHRAGKISSFWA